MEKITVSCGDVLGISEVGQKYIELKEALVSDQSVEISAGELRQIDGAGLQLLVAFIKEANKMHIEINWVGVSEVLIKAASILGVTSQLQLQQQ